MTSIVIDPATQDITLHLNEGAPGVVDTNSVQTLVNKTLTNPSLGNSDFTNIRTATFAGQNLILSTSGAITVDWTLGQHQKQTEPTGSVTYTFTAPVGPCHLQLLIDSDGVSTAQTVVWPAEVVWLGVTWTAVNNKKAIINFWYDGTSYFAMGSTQV